MSVISGRGHHTSHPERGISTVAASLCWHGPCTASPVFPCTQEQRFPHLTGNAWHEVDYSTPHIEGTMHLQLKNLADQVIVITGASSGIGLTTARKAASRGARVVLAARSLDALQQVAAKISADGGTAHAVKTDVISISDIQNLAEEAVSRFGRIDTWVNNAGVSVYGRSLNVPIEARMHPCSRVSPRSERQWLCAPTSSIEG